MPQLGFANSKASLALDVMRALAAAVVFSGHWRNAFFVDYRQVISHRVAWSAFYPFMSAGHQAVILFFVLSGYLVGGSIIRSFQKNSWSWTDYATRRLVRLWLVLIPALALGAFWDGFGIHLGYAPNLYGGANYNHMLAIPVAQSLGVRVAVGNVLFLQTILVRSFGSNGALWSLANEFWYYFLFPLTLIGARPSSSLRARLLSLLAAGCICWLVTSDILLLFPVWLMGVVLNYFPTVQSKIFRICFTAVYVLGFFWIAHLSKMPGAKEIALDWILGIATAVLIWTWLGTSKEKAPLNYTANAFRVGAGFSYTLYATHTPILFFWVAVVTKDHRLQPSLATMVIPVVIGLLIICYAWMVASLTEFHTHRVYVRVLEMVTSITHSKMKATRIRYYVRLHRRA